jgi:hypothetical protein
MRWAGIVACVDVIINAYTFKSENMKGQNHQEDLDADGKVILK